LGHDSFTINRLQPTAKDFGFDPFAFESFVDDEVMRPSSASQSALFTNQWVIMSGKLYLWF
jgi:hypothetical protein